MRICMLLHKSVEHDSRVRREARTLAEAGHEVTVLELDEATRGAGVLDGFRRRSVAPPGWVARVLPPRAYRVAFLFAFLRGVIAERPDVVHAHDAAMLLPGLAGARLTRARLVYDSHELATGVPYRREAATRWVARLERVALRRCAAVITVSDGIARRLQELYGLARRPAVVRNVSDLVVAGSDGAGAGLRARLGIADQPLVLHQGAVGAGRGCETLVRAVAAVETAHLALLGADDARDRTRLSALASSLGAGDRVHALPSVGLDGLLAMTAGADVGVSLLEDTCDNHRLALPNKLFEYLAAGIPVLTSSLPELGRIVREHGVGWTVDPADVGDVARGIERAIVARDDGALAARVTAAARQLRWPVERERLVAVYRDLDAG